MCVFFFSTTFELVSNLQEPWGIAWSDAWHDIIPGLFSNRPICFKQQHADVVLRRRAVCFSSHQPARSQRAQADTPSFSGYVHGNQMEPWAGWVQEQLCASRALRRVLRASFDMSINFQRAALGFSQPWRDLRGLKISKPFAFQCLY